VAVSRSSRVSLIETGTTALLLTTLPRAALGAGPLDDAAGRAYPLEGLAYDAGYGINRVEVSFDGGHSWLEASLDPEIDRYS
jgi:molybdenum-dependent oxidoreductase-like protein